MAAWKVFEMAVLMVDRRDSLALASVVMKVVVLAVLMAVLMAVLTAGLLAV